jgi:hypothetical protein
MKESIKILIEGEDQASATVAAVEAKTKATLNNIKETGGKAKASLDFVGALAGQLGGSEIGAFANQLAGITEKTSQFTAVAKGGGAGALAFKAGLAGLVATAAISAGKFLGDWIFQTEKFAKSVEEAKAKMQEMISATKSMQSEAFSESKVDIELIRDPDKKKAAYQDLLKTVQDDIQKASQYVTQSEKAVEKWNASWNILADDRAAADQARGDLENDKAKLTALQEQEKQLNKILGIDVERAAIRKANQEAEADERAIENLAKRLEMEKAVNAESESVSKLRGEVKQQISMDMDFGGSEEDFSENLKRIIAENEQSLRSRFADATQKVDVEIDQTIVGDENKAKALAIAEEMEFLKQIQSLEKEIQADRAKALASQEEAAKKTSEAYSQEISKIEEQIMLLSEGKEAAKVFALEKQGIAAEDAKRIVEMQRRLEAQQGTDTVQPTGPNMAQESRVMVRGDVDVSPMKDTAKNTEESKKLLDQMLQELKTQSQRLTKPAEQQ